MSDRGRPARLPSLHDAIGIALTLGNHVLRVVEAVLSGELEASLHQTRRHRWIALPAYWWLQRAVQRRWTVAIEVIEEALRGDVEAVLRHKRAARMFLIPLYHHLARRYRSVSSAQR